jgi:hypothetical protein
MSFDLYLQTFQNGKAAGISLHIIRDAFGKYVVELEEDFWQVQYSADESCDIFLQPLADDASSIHTISIHRPCKDIRLWHSLWLLLELPGTIFYYPGCLAPLARDHDAALAMPSDMRQSLGDPVIVNSDLEIFQSVEA